MTFIDMACFVLVLAAGASYFTISAFVHELGHWLAARLLGATCRLEWRRTGRLPVFTTRFAMSSSMTPAQDVLVTTAGVALQFLTTLLIFLQGGPPVLIGLAFISLPLISLNLVPIEPADGYYLLCTIRRIRSGDTQMTLLLAALQWSLFAGSLLAASWCSIAALADFWNRRDATSAGLAVLGATILIRVLQRLHRLHRCSSIG